MVASEIRAEAVAVDSIFRTCKMPGCDEPSVYGRKRNPFCANAGCKATNFSRLMNMVTDYDRKMKWANDKEACAKWHDGLQKQYPLVYERTQLLAFKQRNKCHACGEKMEAPRLVTREPINYTVDAADREYSDLVVMCFPCSVELDHGIAKDGLGRIEAFLEAENA